MIDSHHGWNTSTKPQWLGYVFSLILIIASYRIAVYGHLSDGALMWALSGMAFAQSLVQLFFFFHLGLESSPKWNLISFLFTALVIAIVIGGSLWIMIHLNYNLMPMEH